RVFPQGIGSGDPRPDSIVLWTRVEPSDPAVVETLGYTVAKDAGFVSVVASGRIDVDISSDHTLKLKLTGLLPRTVYYYRFTCRDVTSGVGRTMTAPSPDDDVPVRFAFASCQAFVGRNYYAWRALAAEPPVDFVVFLGDYI